jgi:hypothetical protein
MRGRYIRKLRNRIWGEGRRIVRLRRQALDETHESRMALHRRIDDLKLRRERDANKLEEVCGRGEGILDELRTGAEEVIDRVEEAVGAARGE